MPSFCCPLGFGPNAWMTRPFTGQRNDGRPAVASCFTFGGSGFSAAGVTTFAVGCAAGMLANFCVAGAAILGAAIFGCTAGTCAMAGAGFTGTAAGGLTAGFAARCCGAGPRTPGMMMRSPTFTMVDAGMLLARAISTSGLLYCRDSFISVSPGAMMWTCWPVVAGAVPMGIAGFGAAAVVIGTPTRGGGVVVLPVTSDFGITRGWPGRSLEPFGRLLASAMAEAGTP